ncbi:GNAT family N-acetyltransferase [Paenibacillus sp. M.A.Huq-81]
MLLRRYKKEDAEAVFEAAGRREIAETTVSIPHPYPRETADWWVSFANENFEQGKAYEWGLFKKESPNVYVGNCGFVSVSAEHRNGELGYFIHSDYWNAGYATEACQAIVEFGFNILGLERIKGRCFARNIGSKKVMEKAGLLVEGLAKHEVLKWGTFEDVWHLAVIRSEWQRQQ